MSLRSGQPGSGRSAKLVLFGKGCNNNCSLCPVQGTSFESDKKKILKKIQNRAQDEDQIILAGREPTIHPDFLLFAQSSRDAGYKVIQIVTNARMFAVPGFAEKTLLAGVNEVLVKLFSHEPEIHDSITRVPGSWKQAIQGIENLRKTGSRLGPFFDPVISVGIYVSSRNSSSLQETYDFLDLLKVDEVFLINTGDQVLPELKPKKARTFTLGFDSQFSYEEYAKNKQVLEIKNSRIFKPSAKKPE